MIVEHRTYTLQPGKTGAYLELYESEGLSIQTRHFGQPLGYYSVEIGPMNQVVHLWAYADHADRDARRAGLLADAGWADYLRKMLPLLVSQEVKLLKPARFAPVARAAP